MHDRRLSLYHDEWVIKVNANGAPEDGKQTEQRYETESIMDEVLKATDVAQQSPLETARDLAALKSVRAQYAQASLTSEATVALVTAIIEEKFNRVKQKELGRVAEGIAEVLMESPSARSRLESLWAWLQVKSQ